MAGRGEVLIVDDELGPRESIRMVMKPYYHIDMAASGTEALERIHENTYDLVTLDLTMPDMHGIELLQRIKEEQEGAEVVIVTGYGTLATAQKAIRHGAFDYLTKPFDASEIMRVAQRALRRKRLRDSIQVALSNLLYRSDNSAEVVQYLPHGITLPMRETMSVFRELNLIEFIRVLSRILEEKSPDMHHHSERVNRFCQVLAGRMGLSPEEQECLRIAAFLHDIGKIGISSEILNKAGVLTEADWELVRQHPRRGVELVEPLCLPEETLRIILHHHESFNGLGYPDGLKGDEIPFCARLLKIIDSYDAMISDRPYRKARSLEWVMQELQDCSGTEFDPDIVAVFAHVLSGGALCESGLGPAGDAKRSEVPEIS
jgi:putative nucleotidyltransferase with HDIG domain